MKASVYKRALHTSDLTTCALFVALIAVGGFIRVPVPYVPFTLQFLFTATAGLLLGPVRGAVSVAIYILLGLLGLPIFASGGGISYILQPSFGYLVGFAVGAWLTGFLAGKSRIAALSFGRLTAACFAGLAVVYAAGTLYFYCISRFYLGAVTGLWTLLLYCVVLAIPGDAVLCLVGALLAKRLLPLLNPMGARKKNTIARAKTEDVANVFTQTAQIEGAETNGGDTARIDAHACGCKDERGEKCEREGKRDVTRN